MRTLFKPFYNEVSLFQQISSCEKSIITLFNILERIFSPHERLFICRFFLYSKLIYDFIENIELLLLLKDSYSRGRPLVSFFYSRENKRSSSVNEVSNLPRFHWDFTCFVLTNTVADLIPFTIESIDPMHWMP